MELSGSQLETLRGFIQELSDVQHRLTQAFRHTPSSSESSTLTDQQINDDCANNDGTGHILFRGENVNNSGVFDVNRESAAKVIKDLFQRIQVIESDLSKDELLEYNSAAEREDRSVYGSSAICHDRRESVNPIPRVRSALTYPMSDDFKQYRSNVDESEYLSNVQSEDTESMLRRPRLYLNLYDNLKRHDAKSDSMVAEYSNDESNYLRKHKLYLSRTVISSPKDMLENSKLNASKSHLGEDNMVMNNNSRPAIWPRVKKYGKLIAYNGESIMESEIVVDKHNESSYSGSENNEESSSGSDEQMNEADVEDEAKDERNRTGFDNTAGHECYEPEENTHKPVRDPIWPNLLTSRKCISYNDDDTFSLTTSCDNGAAGMSEDSSDDDKVEIEDVEHTNTEESEDDAAEDEGGDERYTCSICDKTYSCRRSLAQHQCQESSTKHGQSSASDTDKQASVFRAKPKSQGRLSCSTCHYKFADPRGVIYHERVYKGNCINKARRLYHSNNTNESLKKTGEKDVESSEDNVKANVAGNDRDVKKQQSQPRAKTKAKARLSCSTCNRKFADPRGVIYHERVYKGNCINKACRLNNAKNSVNNCTSTGEDAAESSEEDVKPNIANDKSGTEDHTKHVQDKEGAGNTHNKKDFLKVASEFACDVCHKIYACKRNLVGHQHTYKGSCRDLKSKTIFGNLSTTERRDARTDPKSRMSCSTCHRIFAAPRGLLYHENVYKGNCVGKGRRVYRTKGNRIRTITPRPSDIRNAIKDEPLDPECEELMKKLLESERKLEAKEYRLSSDTEDDDRFVNNDVVDKDRLTDKVNGYGEVAVKEEQAVGDFWRRGCTGEAGNKFVKQKVEPKIVRSESGKLKKKYPCPDCFKELCSQNSVNEHRRTYKGKCVTARLGALSRKWYHASQQKNDARYVSDKIVSCNQIASMNANVDSVVNNFVKEGSQTDRDSTIFLQNPGISTEKSEVLMENTAVSLENSGTLPKNSCIPAENFRTNALTGETREDCMCFVCGDKYPSLKALMKHEATHENKDQAPATAQCHICGMIVRKRRMYPHIATHSARYPCDICGKMFHWKCEMSRHRMTHTKEIDYPCDICGRVFKCRNSQIAHKRNVHVNDRQFICAVCGRRFNERHRLRRHTRCVHDNHRPYMCELCDHASSSSFNLRLHMKVHEREARNVTTYRRKRVEQPRPCPTDAYKRPFNNNLVIADSDSRESSN